MMLLAADKAGIDGIGFLLEAGGGKNDLEGKGGESS